MTEPSSAPEGAPSEGAAARARGLIEGFVERATRASGLVARENGPACELLKGTRVVARLVPQRGAVAVDLDSRAGVGDVRVLRRIGLPHPERTRSAAGWRRVVLRHRADANRLLEGLRGATPRAAAAPGIVVGEVRVRRLADFPRPDDGTRVFVETAWPRGVPREAARVDLWMPEVAPSKPLQEAYGPAPGFLRVFRRAYLAELRGGPKAEAVSRLRALRRKGAVTLLVTVRDVERAGAVVLADVVSRGKTPRV